LNAYKVRFNYKFPAKLSLLQKAELGISSNEDIDEPKYITSFYAFVRQRNEGIARNGGLVGRYVMKYREIARNSKIII
jgi:hypothetical protein